VDQRTNNFSLFHLVEQMQVPRAGVMVGNEVHAYYEFEEAERGRPYEVRIRIDDENGVTLSASAPLAVTSATPRHRILIPNLNIPRDGLLRVYAEIRAAGAMEPWQRSPWGWPLSVAIVPVPQPAG
jgi:hypothetical protein